MNVPEVVAKWKEVLVAYCRAHSKEDLERADYEMDALLAPLLAAPVKQLRGFYRSLVEELKQEPAVPYAVWSIFEVWGQTVLDKAKDEEVIDLKTSLAREIATMVERDVQPDIMEAIVGALRWRSPEDLEALKGELGKGAKAKLTGRQSCIFLQVGDAKVML